MMWAGETGDVFTGIYLLICSVMDFIYVARFANIRHSVCSHFTGRTFAAAKWGTNLLCCRCACFSNSQFSVWTVKLRPLGWPSRITDPNKCKNCLLHNAKAQFSTIRQMLKGQNYHTFNAITPLLVRLTIRRTWRQIQLRVDGDRNRNDREDVCYVVSNLIKQFNM
jgi:hypothetical protein